MADLPDRYIEATLLSLNQMLLKKEMWQMKVQEAKISALPSSKSPTEVLITIHQCDIICNINSKC